jgi:peptidyl-prolyl cis-trans isomerase C
MIRTMLVPFLMALLSGAVVDASSILPRKAHNPEDDNDLPIYLQPVEIFGKKMYPATIGIVMGVVLLYITFVVTKPQKSMATASHILITDSDAEQKLIEIKKEITGSSDKSTNSVGRNFSVAASKYSECPSKNKHGLLGTFSEGNMVPPFDKAIFDPNTPLNEVVGPIQTQFGWHLIIIHSRDMNEEKTTEKKTK